MFEIVDEPLRGALVLKAFSAKDERGEFVKTFQGCGFAELGIRFAPEEEYFSISTSDVVRGMHLQLPPYDHQKLVYCVSGSATDVLLDLRPGPAFGASASINLSGANHLMVFVPAGVAHGFRSHQDGTIMVYQTSTPHTPTHDTGVRWDSFGFDWNVESPIISLRDEQLPPLDSFVSPF